MHEHATKPATLSAALSDSPAGLAAWIAEKIVAWSSRPDGTPAFDRDLLLATLTLWSPTQSPRRCCPIGPQSCSRRGHPSRGSVADADSGHHLWW
jgi:hypothetical protein